MSTLEGIYSRIRTLKVLGVLLVHHRGQVATIIEDHVQGLAVLEASDGLVDAPLVLLLSLTLPGEHRHASCGNAKHGISALLTDTRTCTYAAAAWSCVEKMFYTK